MLKLIIEDDEGRKTVVPFVRDEITIGRQEGNTIRLTERNVSRRHARLMRSNGHVLIEDLGSYNGIRINGDRITGQVQVQDGDLIQIGDYDLAIQAENQAGVTVPLDGGGTPTRKLSESSATVPALPAVDAPQASDDDIREADDDGEVGKDAPPPLPKAQATAVIRLDQVEQPNRKRQVIDLDPSEAPRLVVLNTDFAGREFPCSRTELRIGRTDENDIALDHRSLSRTHCKVVREDNGEWRVIDMQSANGLMVNGESYAQVTLRSGDVIELGHVKFKFVGPGESVAVPPPASGDVTREFEPSSRSRVPLIAVGVTFLVLIIGGGGYGLWKVSQSSGGAKTTREPREPVAVKPPPRAPPDEPRVEEPVPEPPPKEDREALKRAALDKVAEARAAAEALDFLKAEGLAKEATVDGALLSEAKQLLQLLEAEKANRVALEKAAKLLEQGQLDKAKTQLSAAASTKLLRGRYEELEAARVAAVEARVASSRPSTPEPTAPPSSATAAKADPKQAQAEELLTQARREIKAENFKNATELLDKCVKLVSTYADCHLQLGSVLAKIGARDGSDEHMERARKHYKLFLEYASPDHKSVPRVREMLQQAAGQ